MTDSSGTPVSSQVRLPRRRKPRKPEKPAEDFPFFAHNNGLWAKKIRAVQRFSRHRDVRILERYDDNRRDLAGDVAKQVAASVPGDSLSI
jgi:hypothetical protein